MTPTHIESLHIEIETLRQRCEAFEAYVAGNGEWEACVRPLSLYQTRLMRLIARKDVTGSDAIRIMGCYYPDTSPNALYCQLVYIRRVLPAEIAPRLRKTKFDYLSVPDREALKQFLASKQMPMARAA
jgi:hypothetical protein